MCFQALGSGSEKSHNAEDGLESDLEEWVEFIHTET